MPGYTKRNLKRAVTRGVEAGPEGLELLAIGGAHAGNPREDAEPLPGWWSD